LGSGSGAARSVQESTSGNTVGTVTGAERFVRGNRAAGDFVGSDSGDRSAFIGAAGETSGSIQSAATGTLVRGSAIAEVNRTRVRAPAPSMYEARLRIAFDFNQPSKAAASQAAARQLKVSRAVDPTSSIEVSVAGSTATLRGVVGSEREKRLAQMMMLFEPGISSVKNELAIASSTGALTDRPSEVRGPEVLDR
jgi:osmotically-inducible protein OsmY